ncbi:hypothetical protein K7W42_22005 [Deinococcus sp. HMF7604]|uniref:hypothetical protein n=1 Tax=Deinococcus betulae TaxID=2873312 RepID=UPI001CCA3F19|nr:hypothetical protein [Deinococcus betulae]MBZ9753509.1 hypothetical protein [Deinococcus betulae]
MTFQVGLPLPSDPQTSQERTLHYAPRGSSPMATMTREGGTWEWRQLRDDDGLREQVAATLIEKLP